MKSKILSLNSGKVARIEWDGKSTLTSMPRSPVARLDVHLDRIEGDRFGTPKHHGVEHNVLYAYGMKSALKYMKALGRDTYEPGYLGENVLLDDFDETQISVGDIFHFGEVIAQATNPRIPCNKVIVRVEHPLGRKIYDEVGVSGVYFRVLRGGRIVKHDEVVRVSEASPSYLISEVFAQTVAKRPLTFAEAERVIANGAFPETAILKAREVLGATAGG